MGQGRTPLWVCWSFNSERMGAITGRDEGTHDRIFLETGKGDFCEVCVWGVGGRFNEGGLNLDDVVGVRMR